MKRAVCLLLCLYSGIAGAQPLLWIGGQSVNSVKSPAAPAPSEPEKLRWNNGETLTGALVAASASGVTWQTPLFQDPLELAWPALRGIEQTVAAIPPADPFVFSLRDGSRVAGDFVSLTDKALTIHSTRHGDAVLKRAEVLSMRRVRSDSLVFNGPFGDAGWTPSVNSSLEMKAAGVLTIPYWNRSASLDIKLPESVEISFRLHSTLRPDFAVVLHGADKQVLAVETWDDELVLTGGDRFKAVRKIPGGESSVDLRLFWDQKARKCSVFTPDGEPVVEWDVPDNAGNSSSDSAMPAFGTPRRMGGGSRNGQTTASLVLQNKGHDLAIDFLKVRTWDRKPPAKIDVSRPRVELSDGTVVQKGASSGSAASLRLGEDDAQPALPLKQVEAVVFSSDPPRPAATEASLSFADGTLVLGSIASVKDGWALLNTSFTERPFGSSLDALRQLLVHALPASQARAGADLVPSAQEGTDHISIQNTTLHGTLIGAGDGEPRWLPVGGVAPAGLSKAFDSEITRALPENTQLPSAPALFYTTAGDVLPGTLRGIDRTGVEFESSLVEAKKLAASSLDAVLFRSASSNLLLGFGDPAWRILKGDENSVQKTKDSLHMAPGTSIAHPQAMQSSEIKFKISTGAFSTLRLRMFCAGTDNSRSTNMILSLMGDRFCSGIETSEGQLDNQIQTRIASSMVGVRLVIKEQSVELYLDDVPHPDFPHPGLQTARVRPHHRAGRPLGEPGGERRAGRLLRATRPWRRAIALYRLGCEDRGLERAAFPQRRPADPRPPGGQRGRAPG